MTKHTEKKGISEFEPRVLNGLTGAGARQYAYKKLREYQERKGWVFNRDTKEFNPVSDEEDLEREIYFDLNAKMVAIFASDKRGVIHSVEELLELAENNEDGFNFLYETAIAINPAFKVEVSKEGEKDPN